MWIVILYGVRLESTTCFPSHAWKPIDNTTNSDRAGRTGFDLINFKDIPSMTRVHKPASAPINLLINSNHVLLTLNSL